MRHEKYYPHPDFLRLCADYDTTPAEMLQGGYTRLGQKLEAFTEEYLAEILEHSAIVYEHPAKVASVVLLRADKLPVETRPSEEEVQDTPYVVSIQLLEHKIHVACPTTASLIHLCPFDFRQFCYVDYLKMMLLSQEGKRVLDLHTDDDDDEVWKGIATAVEELLEQWLQQNTDHLN